MEGMFDHQMFSSAAHQEWVWENTVALSAPSCFCRVTTHVPRLRGASVTLLIYSFSRSCRFLASLPSIYSVFFSRLIAVRMDRIPSFFITSHIFRRFFVLFAHPHRRVLVQFTNSPSRFLFENLPPLRNVVLLLVLSFIYSLCYYYLFIFSLLTLRNILLHGYMVEAWQRSQTKRLSAVASVPSRSCWFGSH